MVNSKRMGKWNFKRGCGERFCTLYTVHGMVVAGKINMAHKKLQLWIKEIRFHNHPNHHDWMEWICNKCCETLNWTKIKEFFFFLFLFFRCSSKGLILFHFVLVFRFKVSVSREWESYPMHSFRSIKFISNRRGVFFFLFGLLLRGIRVGFFTVCLVSIVVQMLHPIGTEMLSANVRENMQKAHTRTFPS